MRAARYIIPLALILLSPSRIFAQPDAFQVRYASHLEIGDSVVNISNTGSTGAGLPRGNICVNVYTFDAAEEMISCCACLVTPNALSSLSARGDLVSNSFSPGVPTSIVIGLVASTPNGNQCDAGSVTSANLAAGLRAWGTTLHALPGSPTKFGFTEDDFLWSTLSAPELNQLTSFCHFIEKNGSGFGICASCRFAGMSGAKQQ